MLHEGTVIKSTGSWYNVQIKDSKEILPSRIIGKFRLDGLKITNPVAVGDIVKITKEDDGVGTIKEIVPRTNYVVRQSPRKKHNLHLLAANIDQAILVITIRDPKLKQGFIDRFLLMTEPYNIPVTIVFNKVDLYDEGDMNMFDYLKEIYNEIGYHVLLTSVPSGEGIDDLREVLKNKISLISGQSGVGKSSLINVLLPDIKLKTTEISEYMGKGQHTTTFAEMFDIGEEGKIIDTPGIKTLGFNHLEVMDIAHNFREFFAISENCKFGDCTHRNEPKCAVKEGIEEGTISELRYLNYIQLLEEVEDQNYWEINTQY